MRVSSLGRLVALFIPSSGSAASSSASSLNTTDDCSVLRDWMQVSTVASYFNATDIEAPGWCCPMPPRPPVTGITCANVTNGASRLSEGGDSGWHRRVTGIYIAEGAGVKGKLPASFRNLSALSSYSSVYNPLVGTLDEFPPSLTRLDIKSCEGFHGSLEPLAELEHLTHVDVCDNSLSGSIPPALATLASLSYLSLCGNQLEGTLPSTLASLAPRLTYLNLGLNNLSGILPDWLRNFKLLSLMVLQVNRFSGTLPAWLSKLTNLTVLALDYNDLSGTLPKDIGSLTGLQALYLSSNNFTGSIPSSLSKLNNLQGLYFDHNSLSGTLPKAIGKLSKLNFLYLDDNSFSGMVLEFNTYFHLTFLCVFAFQAHCQRSWASCGG